MIRPLHDWLLVELEPERKTFYKIDIFKVSDLDPIRSGYIRAVGPGRQFKEKFVATEVKVGERVAFMIAGTQTKVGKQLGFILPENQVLIRETDILAVIEEGVEVSR